MPDELHPPSNKKAIPLCRKIASQNALLPLELRKIEVCSDASPCGHIDHLGLIHSGIAV